jgi:hypothetical protein
MEIDILLTGPRRQDIDPGPREPADTINYNMVPSKLVHE